MPFQVLYFLVFLIAVSGLVARVLWTRHRRLLVYEAQPDADRAHGTRPLPVAETTSPGLSRVTPTDLPSIEFDQLPTQAPIAQLLFASASRGDHKECPRCHRRFGETVVLCPFDAAPLRALHARSRRTARPAVTGSRRPSCAGCGRRYESAASYCYHDGAALSADSPAEVPIVRACRACGFESLDPKARCACTHPDLVEVDPSRSQIQMPTIPIMECRRCDYMAAPSETYCPHDGALLYPVMNVQINALPPTGIGPKRRVCEQCGRKFSTAAHYCAYDGKKLRDLN